MRTTIRLKDHLSRAVKRLAGQENRTFTELAEEAFSLLLAERRKRGAAAARPVKLPTADLGPARPGLDLNKPSRVLDQLDQDLPLEKRR